jgi:putative nucleotidyltransferase with HDIG domain
MRSHYGTGRGSYVSSRFSDYTSGRGRTADSARFIVGRPMMDVPAGSVVDRGSAAINVAQKSGDALLAMLAARDPHANEHARAVGRWARRICAQMELSSGTTELVAVCSLLHDVGMISTPEVVLNKVATLSKIETAILRDHTVAGERILRGIPDLEPCARIVRSHHERWDGEGYPDGIAGVNIPFESRVVAVADGFHAMISDRPYRGAISPRVALDILVAGSGTQWDPAVVSAVQAMFSYAQSDQSPKVSSTP